MGLAISRELVRLMHGEINAKSTPGKGSNFYFTVQFEIVNFGNTEIYQFGSLEGKNILVIDDNRSNRKIVRAYLEETGCKVTEAESADQALALLQALKDPESMFDIGLVDYQMPGMEGYQFAATLQGIPFLKDKKLILLTSSGQQGDAGLAGFLSKPIKRSELLDCISIVLELLKSPDDSYTHVGELVEKYTVKEAKMAMMPKILLAEDNEIN